MRSILRSQRAWLAVIALLLAFGLLGSRGLWDPDEGRYTNVALNMLGSGDWVNPMRNEDTGHWTKPPMTYWAIASSIAVFGPSPWSARLPSALAYLACIFLCWRCARRLIPGSQDTAALAYMFMLMPFIAGQLVTTDFILTAFQTLAVYGFVEWQFGGEARRAGWLWLMWAAFAAAFLTKGPPALLPLLVMVVFSLLAPSGRPIDWLATAGGIVMFLSLVLPWFVVVSVEHPGLLGYFLGSEVVARVASNQFGRHGEWYGWLEIYLPTLLVGTLPWTRSLWAWLRQLPMQVRSWRSQQVRAADAPAFLLTLWVFIPLLVFCLARSRLPLYLLPLFVPLALLVARQRAMSSLSLPKWQWLIAWLLLLLSMRLGAALVPTDKDAATWARAIFERMQEPVKEVVFLEDLPRYGLQMYMGAEVETLSFQELGPAVFNPEYDESLATELAETASEGGVVYVTRQRTWPEARARIAAHGLEAIAQGTPYKGRIFFVVRPAASRR